MCSTRKMVNHPRKMGMGGAMALKKSNLIEVLKDNLMLWMITQENLGLLSILLKPQLFFLLTDSSRSGILLKVDEQESKHES